MWLTLIINHNLTTPHSITFQRNLTITLTLILTLGAFALNLIVLTVVPQSARYRLMPVGFQLLLLLLLLHMPQRPLMLQCRTVAVTTALYNTRICGIDTV